MKTTQTTAQPGTAFVDVAAANDPNYVSPPTALLLLDRKVLKSFFAAFRTSIPPDVQRTLIRSSAEELQFLIARQPRLSAFHHRRRQSLRHPALAMATKNYYQLCRRRRLELDQHSPMARGGHQQQTRQPTGKEGNLLNPLFQSDGYGTQQAAQHEAELVDLLLFDFAQAGRQREEGGWTGATRSFGAASAHEGLGTMGSVTGGSLPGGGDGYDDDSVSQSGPLGRYVNQALTDRTSFSSHGVSALTLKSKDSALFHQLQVAENSVTAMSDSMASRSPSRHGGQSALAYSMNTSAAGGSTFGPGRSTHSRRSRHGTSATMNSGFFAKRNGGTGRTNGGAGRGRGAAADGGFAWGAKLHALLLHRVEEEVKAGAIGDPYLITSPCPVEHLLCCYGGIQRDPATTAFGAAALLLLYDPGSPSATPAEADQLYDVIVDEDTRWSQLAQCHQQLLRETTTTREAAAATMAQDPVVNTIVRRFWTRLTVSQGAAKRAELQQAQQKEATAAAVANAGVAARARVRVRTADGDSGEEEEEGDGEQEEEAEAAAASPATSQGASGKTRRKGVAAAKAKPKRKIKRPPGGGDKANHSSAAAAEEAAAASAAAMVNPAEEVALYMTPFQYVYLHTRIANILLPDCAATEVELLGYIQEDLLIDAAYDETDSHQTCYFGHAPPLEPLSSAVVHPSAEVAAAGRDSEDDVRGSVNTSTRKGPSDAAVLTPVQQRFLKVRRHGHATGTDEDGRSIRRGDAGSVSRVSTIIGNANKEKGSTAPATLPLQHPIFVLADLPALTYPQFWCSMLELADNWTCCAGHPVETAVFFWELYAEVFGHDWGPEDEALAAALEHKAANVTPAERAEMEKEVTDALASFLNLIHAIRSHDADQQALSRSASTRDLYRNILDDDEGGKRASARLAGGAAEQQQQQPTTSGEGKHDPAAAAVAQGYGALPDLPVAMWQQIVLRAEDAADRWVYAEEIDAAGVKHLYRRRLVHKEEIAGRRRAEDANDPLETSYALEEELNDIGVVVQQRKRYCKAAAEENGDPNGVAGAGGRPRPGAAGYRSGNEARDEMAGGGKDGGVGRQSRTLGGASLAEGGDDGEGTDMDGAGGARGGEDAVSSAAAHHFPLPVSKDDLSAVELHRLLDNKDWLIAMLSKRGVVLPPRLFDDPAKQRLLYELLRLAKGGVGENGVDMEDIFQLLAGGGGGGGAVLDLTHLAALLSQTNALQLSDLEGTDLMRELLGDDEDDESGRPRPTEEQLRNIRRPLGDRRGSHQADRLHRRGGGSQSTRTDQQENAAAAAAAAANNADNTGGEAAVTDTFGLTAGPPTRPSAVGFVSPFPADAGAETGIQDEGGDASGKGRAPSHALGSLSLPVSVADTTSDPGFIPLTEAELREQDRLMHALQRYWTDKTSLGGRYRVDVVSYTVAQLEEFFAHLHLGNRQRVLVLGRAPLAPATSLNGGTLHQEAMMAYAGGYRLTAVSTKPMSGGQHAFPVAPVKLFTLTTAPSLEGALQQSCQSYLNDRAYREYMERRRVESSSAPARKAVQRSSPSPALPSVAVGRITVRPASHPPLQREHPRTPDYLPRL